MCCPNVSRASCPRSFELQIVFVARHRYTLGNTPRRQCFLFSKSTLIANSLSPLNQAEFASNSPNASREISMNSPFISPYYPKETGNPQQVRKMKKLCLGIEIALGKIPLGKFRRSSWSRTISKKASKRKKCSTWNIFHKNRKIEK